MMLTTDEADAIEISYRDSRKKWWQRTMAVVFVLEAALFMKAAFDHITTQEVCGAAPYDLETDKAKQVALDNLRQALGHHTFAQNHYFLESADKAIAEANIETGQGFLLCMDVRNGFLGTLVDITTVYDEPIHVKPLPSTAGK